MRTPLHSAIISGWLLAGILTATGSFAELTSRPTAVLTNAVDVLDLTAEQAALGQPVQLRGVVVDESQPREQALILADQTSGIYLFAKTNLFAPYHRNDLLEITGVTAPGQFAPIVLTTKAHWLARDVIPLPRPTTYQQLITGVMDGQFVEVKGVVRQCSPPLPGDETWRIVLAADGGTIPVRIPLPQDPQIQEDAEVTIEAVCLYQFNRKRQALSPILQVPRGLSVRINRLSPADPYSAPVRPAASLLQYSRVFPFGHRVHVHGVVTLSLGDSRVWIRDESSGLRIRIRQTDDLLPGDEIDALGFPGYDSSTPVLDDAVYRKMQTLPPPIPLTLTNPVEALDHQDDLVSLDAMLTDIQPVQHGLVLTLEQNTTVFKAIMRSPFKPNRQPAWQPGSWVRLAGICDVIYEDTRPVMGIWNPQSFQILLRSPDDVTILQAPSWWTTRHLMFVLGLVALTSSTITSVVVLLARRRLHELARRRAMAEREFSAILTERNRLAREIHDTLSQGLTATSVHLQLMEKFADGASEGMKQHLQLSQQMVRNSLKDARNSIWNMRSQVLESNNLSDALRSILKQTTDADKMETQVEVTGQERRLSPVIENNLLRVGQEAITNAAKHAGAKHIKVALDFGKTNFVLTVVDDGRGFDPISPRSRKGGFGLLGMRERAGELHGELKVRTASNQGTEICLQVPLSD